jgi:hypothetical protein
MPYVQRKAGQGFQEHERGSNSALRNAMTLQNISSLGQGCGRNVRVFCGFEAAAFCGWGWRVVTTEKRLLPTR